MTTQYANASYQEVIDLHTESDTVSVVGIHTPNSDTPVKMLHGFWEQFRKVKYNGCSISLVPAARLPADPLQVSYGAGATTIDPRDMLNPILFHGCHGNDLGVILDTLYNDAGSTGEPTRQYSDSTEQNILPAANLVGNAYVEALYYRALTDKTWLKAHPQKGFRKSGLHPMVYSVASSIQLNPGSYGTGIHPRALIHNDITGTVGISTNGTAGYVGNGEYTANGFGLPYMDTNLNKEKLPKETPAYIAGFMTPRLQRLGWMDTKNIVGATDDVLSDTLNGGPNDDAKISKMWCDADHMLSYAKIPKVFMAMVMLPPAYKTEQYFRLVINHSFSFAKFRGASMQYYDQGMVSVAPAVYDFNGDPDKKIDPEPEPEVGKNDFE